MHLYIFPCRVHGFSLSSDVGYAEVLNTSRSCALKCIMHITFHRLFVHRYRDIDPEVRMSCIQSLGVWILLYPSLFLQDLYLKYLGWTLNDKVSCASNQALYRVFCLQIAWGKENSFLLDILVIFEEFWCTKSFCPCTTKSL